MVGTPAERVLPGIQSPEEQSGWRAGYVGGRRELALRSGMLSALHIAQRCSGKLNKRFAVAHRGLNLLVDPPRSVRHSLFSGGADAPGRMRAPRTLRALPGVTELSRQPCCSSAVWEPLSTGGSPLPGRPVGLCLWSLIVGFRNCGTNIFFCIVREMFIFFTSATPICVLSRGLKGKAFCVA